MRSPAIECLSRICSFLLKRWNMAKTWIADTCPCSRFKKPRVRKFGRRVAAVDKHKPDVYSTRRRIQNNGTP